MPSRHLLLLDASELTLFSGPPSRLGEVQRFSQDEAGQAAFQAWLAAHPDTELSLLANLSEEGFQVETLPYLRGRDRQAVLERKLARQFGGTPLTLAQSLGHRHSHRKEERVLLAALTRPALVEPWLAAIRAARVRFTGLYGIAQLTGRLCRQLGLPRERCLILTLHPQGLRESLVQEGEAVFSRLTRLPDGSLAELAAGIASEAHKLHRYLSSQGWIDRDERLTVCPLLPPQAVKAVRAACPDQGALCFQVEDLFSAAERLELRPDSDADALFLSLLARRRPRPQFAPVALCRDHEAARIRSGLIAAGLVIFLSGMLWMGRAWQIASEREEQTARLDAEAASHEAEYANLAREVSGPAQDPESLRLLLTRYDELQRQQDSPMRTLGELSHALDAVPAAQLEKLHWESGRAGSTLAVEGRLPATEPRLLMSRFEQLLRALGNQGIRTEILTQPVDFGPDKPLRGSDLDQDTAPAPDFKLRLYGKPTS